MSSSSSTDSLPGVGLDPPTFPGDHGDTYGYEDYSNSYDSDHYLVGLSDAEQPWPSGSSEAGTFSEAGDDSDLERQNSPANYHPEVLAPPGFDSHPAHASEPELFSYTGKSTPVAYKPSSLSSNNVPAVGPNHLDAAHLEHDKEMSGKWAELGVETFMERFTPGDDLPSELIGRLPAYKLPVNTRSGELLESVNEKRLYQPIVEGIRETLKCLGCNTLMAYQTDTYGDAAAPGSDETRDSIPFRPDIAIYPTTSDAKEAYKLPPLKPKRTVPPPEQGTHDDGGKERSCGDSPRLPDADLSATENDSMIHGSEDSSRPIPTPNQPVGSDGIDARTLGVVGDSVAHEPLVARMSWANAEIIIEVKGNKNKAPFSTMIPKESSEHGGRILSGWDRKLARGQATHYGVGIFNRQHRQHMFILSIVYNIARFIYFDRSGAVYSRAFDYYKDPVILATFLYRFSKMLPEQRGHDPTASLASKDEHRLFRKLWETYPNSAMSQHNPVPIAALKRAGTQGWPVYALDVYAQWSNRSRSRPHNLPFTSHRCLVGRPDRVSGSLTGRGTRGFVAYDLTDKRVVYIKDSWRAIAKDVPSEYDNYWRLYDRLSPEKSNNKAGLLTVLAGGDVRYPESLKKVKPGSGTAPALQNTRAQDFFSGEPVATPLMRRHHRLVFKEVCRPLEDFGTAYDLFCALFRALSAHKFAWEEAGMLHRDISVNNILLYDTPEGPSGILADWDLAKTKDQLSNQSATQPSRSGTWQFISALRQCYPLTPCRLSDDLESFMHVFNWIALKYLKHSNTHEDKERIKAQCKWFHEVFDERPPPEGMETRDDRHIKFRYIVKGKPFVNIYPHLPHNPLNVFLSRLIGLFQAHYQSDEVRAIWAEPTPSQPQPSSVPKPATVVNPNGLELIYETLGKSEPLPPPLIGASLEDPLNTTSGKPRVASPLTSHLPVIKLFLSTVLVPQEMWSAIEKTPNQVVSWTPSIHDMPIATSDSTDSWMSTTGSKRTPDAAGPEDSNAETQHSDVRRSVAERNLRSSSRGSISRGRSESPRGKGPVSQVISGKPGPSRLNVALDASTLASPETSPDDGPPVTVYPAAGTAPKHIPHATSSSLRNTSRSANRSGSAIAPTQAEGKRSKRSGTDKMGKGKGKATGNDAASRDGEA
ncbi:hypothetical protein C8Q79DRAFT_1033321 [Trametes meyenii]|nr:hypothetical protein C8Q79DRAFT_1033321 [Trametes meyenii]